MAWGQITSNSIVHNATNFCCNASAHADCNAVTWMRFLQFLSLSYLIFSLWNFKLTKLVVGQEEWRRNEWRHIAHPITLLCLAMLLDFKIVKVKIKTGGKKRWFDEARISSNAYFGGNLPSEKPRIGTAIKSLENVSCVFLKRVACKACISWSWQSAEDPDQCISRTPSYYIIDVVLSISTFETEECDVIVQYVSVRLHHEFMNTSE